MNKEQWREVVGYDGGYQVSDQGRVRDASGILIEPRIQNGYKVIALKASGRHKTAYIHRLVIMAFVGPIPHGMQVHHKNADRKDSRLSNLEIVNPSQHQHKDFWLRCAQIEPGRQGDGIRMFDRSKGFSQG